MSNFNRLRGFAAAALAVSSLFAAQPATADIIEIKNFWAGAGSATINFDGTDWHTQSRAIIMDEQGGSGGFLTYNLSKDPSSQNGFQSFCVDIFHSFGFAVQSADTQQNAATVLGAQAAADLGQLYSNHFNDISATTGNAENESAFQLAVWEIVNENRDNPYDISDGAFRVEGTGESLARDWLAELIPGAVSKYVANIWVVERTSNSVYGPQDVVTFSPVASVPEPQTYAMMLVGLGLLGFSARRKKQNLM